MTLSQAIGRSAFRRPTLRDFAGDIMLPRDAAFLDARREHPDLFWALRGGGPSFGVVVELEFELHPVQTVVGGMMAWPAHRASEVAVAYEALMRHAPDDLGGGLALLDSPPARFVSDALTNGPTVAVIVLWTGEPGRADAAIAPLRALGPAVDGVRPMPYATLQGIFESPSRYTARIHGEGAFLTGLPPELMAVLAKQQARKPVPLGSLLLQPMGGAFARVPEGATPLGQRDAPWALQGRRWVVRRVPGRRRAGVGGRPA